MVLPSALNEHVVSLHSCDFTYDLTLDVLFVHFLEMCRFYDLDLYVYV